MMTAANNDGNNADMTASPVPSTGERAVKDTAKQFAAQLAIGLVAVGFSAWLNRLLPAKELALIPICTSIGGLVSAISSFGLGDTYVRLVPALLAKGERAEASALLRSGLLLNALGCGLLALVTYVLAEQAARYLLHDPLQAPYIQKMALAAFLLAVAERLNWAQSGVQQFGKQAITKVIAGILRMPLAVGLYFLIGGATGVIWALTIVAALSCVLSFWWLWPYLTAARHFYPLSSLLKFSVPYYGVSLLGLLVGRLNNLVIALLVKPEVLATYFVAANVASYVDALNRFAITATTPKLAEKSINEPAALESIFTKCIRYAFLFLLPVHVLIAVAAQPLMRLYGGSQYVDAAPILVIMCVGLYIDLLYRVHRAHIHALAKPTHLLGLSFSESVGNMGALLLLVPPLGALGAALSDGVTSLLQLIVSGTVLRRTMRLVYDYQALLLAGSASAAAGLLLWLVHPLWQAHAVVVLPLLGVAALIYLAALTRRIRASDADLLISSLPARLRVTRMGQAVAHGARWLLVKT